MYIEYTAFPPCGEWLLNDEDWYALEAEGWKVAWAGTFPNRKLPLDENGLPRFKDKDVPPEWCSVDEQGRVRHFGALAQRAYFSCHTIEEAVVSFRRVTGRDAKKDILTFARCFTGPHDFSRWTDSHELVDFGYL